MDSVSQGGLSSRQSGEQPAVSGREKNLGLVSAGLTSGSVNVFQGSPSHPDDSRNIKHLPEAPQELVMIVLPLVQVMILCLSPSPKNLGPHFTSSPTSTVENGDLTCKSHRPRF